MLALVYYRLQVSTELVHSVVAGGGGGWWWVIIILIIIIMLISVVHAPRTISPMKATSAHTV